ncbi:MAG: bifunctional nuclease family protein [Chloroflexi bacterium]|nr:bifunctional nuclease family protein [Chloroflexota bacterium]
MGNTPSDTELVRQARAGDTDAFASLLDRYRRMMEIVSARVVKDHSAVDDLVQEATLTAFLSLRELRDPERFGAWLCGIALNLCRSYLRQLHSDMPLDLVGGSANASDQLDSDGDPASIFEEKELRARVLTAVSELPLATKSATLLFYYRQMSVREIAAGLGISVGAVRVRLNRARQRLRRQLAVPESVVIGKRRTAMQKVYVADVVQSEGGTGIHGPKSSGNVVMLAAESGDRALPIWVGRDSVSAIALGARKVEVPRPHTFALINSLLDAAGVTVKEVRVERLERNVFYAVVVVSSRNGVQEIDARPSDAIALATHMGSPIFVSDEVMKQAGMDIPSRDRSEPVSGSGLEALVTEMEQHFQPVEGCASMSEDEKNTMYRKLVETVFGEEK